MTMKHKIILIYEILDRFSPTEELRAAAYDDADVIIQTGIDLNYNQPHGFDEEELEEIFSSWYGRVPVNECLEILLLHY